MCDWIDNALTLQMEKRVEMYAYFRLPCQVTVRFLGSRFQMQGSRSQA